MREDEKLARFEQVVFPHLEAAYNLARWLTRNDHDAQDVVQETCLRAYQFFDGFHAADGRPWLLRIVRNTCYTWMKKKRLREPAMTFCEQKHSGTAPTMNPDNLLLRNEDRELLKQALDELPPEYREVIVLRELEELSYKEIAGIAGVPLGTVTSRLARARERLLQVLTRRLDKES